MARKPQRRREFGNVRKTESGRFQARYWAPDGKRRYAPKTFETKTEATTWLALTQADIERKHWTDPDAGAVNFEDFARKWVGERGLAATTEDLYARLLARHIVPTFGTWDLDEIQPSDVRVWRAERLKATNGAKTTVAKSYRLLKAILQTAVDDDLLKSNPCRIKGAGKEEADERDVAEVEQVYALAEAIGPRWRIMIFLGAFASLRPEELAELRRSDIDVDEGVVWIRRAAPELTNGKKVIGDPKSRAGCTCLTSSCPSCTATFSGSPRRSRTDSSSWASEGPLCDGPPSGASGARRASRWDCRTTSASTICATPATPWRLTLVLSSRTSWSARASPARRLS
jgi:hypothetical protein